MVRSDEESKTEVRPLQLENAELSIDVTEFGNVSEVNPVQFPNAEEPIDVTEFGKFTAVIFLQSKKALFPMDCTLDGIVNSPVFEMVHWIRLIWFLSNKTPFQLE